MTEEFEKMATEWRNRMLDDWGAMAKTMVGSDAFGAASAATMDWSLLMQKQTRSQMGQWLEAMEIPKRSDIARVSKEVKGVEQRVADCEDRLDQVNDSLKKVARQLEKLASKMDDQPIDGAALAALATQLTEVNKRLAEQPQAAAEAPAPKPRPRPVRKPRSK